MPQELGGPNPNLCRLRYLCHKQKMFRRISSQIIDVIDSFLKGNYCNALLDNISSSARLQLAPNKAQAREQAYQNLVHR